MAIITSGSFRKFASRFERNLPAPNKPTRRNTTFKSSPKSSSDKRYEGAWVWSAWAWRKPGRGSPVVYSDMQQGFVRRTTNVVIALGMQEVTMEAIQDCLYDQIFDKTKQLSRSMYLSTDSGRQHLQQWLRSGSTYLDGQPLFSTTHVRKGGGTYSNRLAAGIDLSELALETIYANVMANRDERETSFPL